MVFLLQIRDTEVLGPRSGIKKWIFNMILLILSPLVQPGTLLGFVYCWKTGDTRHEVGSSTYEPGTDTWQKAGTMTLPRRDHVVAVFPDVSQLCP